jgi:hypothetical protein
MRLNIAIRTESDIAVDNNYGRLSLGADLRPDQHPGAAALAGGRPSGSGIITLADDHAARVRAIDFANPTGSSPT